MNREPWSAFELANGRAFWRISGLTKQQVVLERTDLPEDVVTHTIQMTHRASGFVARLDRYHPGEEMPMPLPVEEQTGLAVLDVQDAIERLMDSSETLVPPDYPTDTE